MRERVGGDGMECGKRGEVEVEGVGVGRWYWGGLRIEEKSRGREAIRP